MAEHILIVEDDEVLRTTLELELRSAGFRVSSAENGLAAIELARLQSFDLVISDVRMPGIDGLDTVSSIRELQPMARCIVITGYANLEAPVRAIKLRVDDYLLKPFSSQDLLGSVRSSLEAYRQAAQARRPSLRESVIRLISAALYEGHFPRRAGHSERVAAHCLAVAQELGFTAQRQQSLFLASLLHDAGFYLLPERLMEADDLSPAEIEMLRTHPTLARELLEPFTGLKAVATIIVHHHERWDGTGYPRGLKAENIPLESRILALAEAYEEQGTLDELERQAGQAFDPELVPLFAQTVQLDRTRRASLPALGADSRRAALLLSLAEVYTDLGTLDLAETAYDQAGRSLGTDQGELWMRVERGKLELLTQKGEVTLALEHGRNLLAHARARGLDFPAAQLCLQLAHLGLKHGDPLEEESLAQARHIFSVWESAYHLCVADLFLGLVQARAASSELARTYQDFVTAALEGEFFDILSRYPDEADALILEGLEKGLAPQDTLTLLRRAAPHSLEVLERLQGCSDPRVRLQVVEALRPMGEARARALLARAQTDPAEEVAQAALRAPGGARGEQVQILFFGPFRVVIGDRPLEDEAWPTRKIRSLFAFLAARRGEVVHEERLMDLFWEQGGPGARHSLHNSVSQIRRVFADRMGSQARKLLLRKNLGYLIAQEAHCHTDLELFIKHSDWARYLVGRERWDEALVELQKLERLYRGEFMEGTYDEWCADLRLKTQSRFLEALQLLSRYFQNKGKHAVAADYWRKALAQDSCCEDAYQGLMECQLALGRPSEAIATYHQCVQTLKKDLQLGPPPRLVDLYQRLAITAPRLD